VTRVHAASEYEPPPLAFELGICSGMARRGRMRFARCSVETPAFMPVATQASVKAVAPDELEVSGARMLIANTYHLWLRPGPEVISAAGGLHTFMRWPHAIATDSGGFQAFSLASRVKVSEAGFEFSSHLDGAKKLLSPEQSMRLQIAFGADLAMQLDVCPAAGVDAEVLARAVELTSNFAKRCLAVRSPKQALFGIVQGGTDVGLRRRHAETLGALAFDGLALGGFSVGEPAQVMYEVLRGTLPALDERRPRYLMGVGTPRDLLVAIGLGVDLFDCVLPTRNARNGQAFVDPPSAALERAGLERHGPRLVIKHAAYRDDLRPLQPGCDCPSCVGGYSRAYLRHLFMAGELLAYRLLTLHNLHFFARLLSDARSAIEQGSYAAFARERLARLGYSELPAAL
jgi:queuine tRNA-ribosyltransferase